MLKFSIKKKNTYFLFALDIMTKIFLKNKKKIL